MTRLSCCFLLLSGICTAADVPDLPAKARLVLEEDWSSGAIDPKRWYPLRKQWGKGNFGVVPENVSLVQDTVDGKKQVVLRCEAHGDHYQGPVTGQWKKKQRVGGVLVSKQHFLSGRFEVRMQVGSTEMPRPQGMVPAIWTYGYRLVKGAPEKSDDFQPNQPLYHPSLQQWGKGLCFYWSEIDFPEYGKKGEYGTPMYNTFLNKQHHSATFDVGNTADGAYHTYVTDWRTGLRPIAGVRDHQVAEAEGYYWIQDKAVPYDQYWGNPLKKLGPNQYAVCSGLTATHYIDDKHIGENTKFVPSTGGQLNLGVWLPEWAGTAPWAVSAVHVSRVRVWQFDDPGDVKGVLRDDITSNFDKEGNPVKP